MNPKKIKKTIIVASFVSVSAQFHFNFFIEGFIVAMSVVVMALFVFCYEDLSPTYIICLSGIFSPLLRIISDVISGDTLKNVLLLVLPDSVFFFSYAIFYYLIYKFVIRAPKSTKNFYYVIFFCDILSNVLEISCRSVLLGNNLLSIRTIAFLAAIALVRTAIIMTVIIAIESYGNFLINQERDREYKSLLTKAATISGELHIMNKNVDDVENVMKQAYNLYYSIKDRNVDKKIVSDVLSIAKNTHEIKADYKNVLDVLNHSFLGSLRNEKLRISEIISLERSNVLATANKNGYNVKITSRINTDFYVNKTFQMMSVLRNLLTNAVEAIGAGPGKVTVTVSAQTEPSDPYRTPINYVITVTDTGQGIMPDDMRKLFMEGFSTKFDPNTGIIQRGLGLCLVKDYIEEDFSGHISIKSEPGAGTEFELIIPAGSMQGD